MPRDGEILPSAIQGSLLLSLQISAHVLGFREAVSPSFPEYPRDVHMYRAWSWSVGLGIVVHLSEPVAW